MRSKVRPFFISKIVYVGFRSKSVNVFRIWHRSFKTYRRPIERKTFYTQKKKEYIYIYFFRYSQSYTISTQLNRGM
jgi:hypothetical protein